VNRFDKEGRIGVGRALERERYNRVVYKLLRVVPLDMRVHSV
jgi:hypothetical protein